jgi:internalin A
MGTSSVDTPQWALERIREAKEKKSDFLDLWINLGNPGQKLTNFPDEILELPRLRILNLFNNELSALPESISQLQNLVALELSFNRLSTLPDSITKLSNLKSLALRGNQISMLPQSIGQLQNLATLDLSVNELRTLPASITQLQSLTELDLSRNRLHTLPASISQLQNLNLLNLHDNPLVSPPMEIAERGIRAIREYFRQLRQEGVDHLYEAKMLILGEGGAGKTTFAYKLLNDNYTLRDEGSTKGVDVLNWSFPIEGGGQFRVNIWDFGGQEIYHATHQFFLTRRSLYALVADTRKEDTDFYYWLNVAELLSDNSPLLIVNNEKQDRHREINERQLKGQFDGLKEVLVTNLATNRGLEQVREAVKYHIKTLPHIGSPLPKTWVRVREQLEGDLRDYISLDEYLAVCKENGFTATKDALQLSGYLHDIGVFLHFQDEPLLRKTVILKPKWGTDAVYQVLDNKTVIRNLGRFTRLDLAKIWVEPQYENMHDELLQLMMKFRLCYEIPTQRGTYIAPQLLTENQPEYEWEGKENLLLRYNYEFMPKGILTQFIVVMHPRIWEQRKVWKSGIVIEQGGTRAEVIEYYGKREIHVRVAGAQSRDLMTIIRHELKTIHDAYRKLKYDELVPCNCSTCKVNQEPHFYAVAELLDFRANHQWEIQCRRKPYHMVNVMELLGDVIELGKSTKEDARPPIYVQVDYVEGDKKVAKFNQTIKASTIHGSVVAAESIKNSFTVIEKSSARDELKDHLKLLTQAVDAMIKDLPKDRAEEAAEDMKMLAEQAVKEKPNPKWYNVSIEGLTAAAQNLGKVGDAVIELTGKIRKILTGGL